MNKGSLSSLMIDYIFEKIDSFANDLVLCARYISPLTSVSEDAVFKEECKGCAYEKKRLQLVLSVKPFSTGCSSILTEAKDGQGARLFVLCIRLF